MIQLLFALALFIHGTQAAPVNENCIKDILILWDNSFSIGRSPFKNVVKPFITRLIQSKRLRVGIDGTNIGVISFSTYKNTFELWNITDFPKQDNLLKEVNKLKYEKLKGDGTRTGYALKIANKLFSKPNPSNYRENVQDVVLLFTDGKPVWRLRHPHYEKKNGFKSAIREAYHYANELKKKNIKIVGLATGSKENIKKYEKHIQAWSTSKDHTFKAEFEKLDDVLDELVNATCDEPPTTTPPSTTTTSTSEPSPNVKAGNFCVCHSVGIEKHLEPGNDGVVIKLEPPLVPTLNCPKYAPKIIKTTILPEDARSGTEIFRKLGPHHVYYTFTYQSGKENYRQTCPLQIDVLGCDLKCPPRQTVNAVITPGATSAFAKWNEPTPTCEATKVFDDDYKIPEGYFSEGQHQIKYVYTSKDENQTNEISCYVDMNVTVCECPPKERLTAKLKSGQSKALVKWKEPKPSCSVKLKATDFSSQQGRFSLGEHTVDYVYTHVNGGFDMTCSVDIEVEGKLCNGVAYELESQECCCGNLHTVKPGHECCGINYHNKALTRCCDSNANVVLIDETCPIQNY